MSTVDPQKAARVWQRVQAEREMPKQPSQDNVQELILGEWTAASTYLQLARQMPPREAAILQRLGREEQNHVSCLNGIFTLMNGEKPAIRPQKVQIDTPERTLRRCYGAQMRSLKAYEARRGDPEYGPVFQMLADQEREHCRTLLELIGRVGKQHNR